MENEVGPYTTVHNISQTLSEDTTLVKNWLQFYDSLPCQHPHIVQLQRGFNNGTIFAYDVLSSIVGNWVESRGDTVMVKELAEILQSNKLLSATESITKKFGPDTIIRFNRVDFPKWWPEEIELVLSFVHRTDGDTRPLVEKIHELLSNQETPKRITIAGLGGMGKTSLAKSYSICYKDRYSHIIWLDCGLGRLSGRIESIRKLSEALHIATPDDDETDVITDAQNCFKKLSKLLKDSLCLIVFDNVESYTDIRNVLPPKNYQRFHTLITSRGRNWGSGTGYGEVKTLDLGPFALEDGVKFLQKNLLRSQNIHVSVLENLSNQLHNFPLSLQIAVATFNEDYIDINRFIEHLKSSNLINNPARNPDDYNLSFNSILDTTISIVRRHERGDLAFRIMQLLAYLIPDNIPHELFVDLESTPLGNIIAAIKILKLHSLLEQNSFENSVSIHRVTQQGMRCISGKYELGILKKLLNLNSSESTSYKLIPYEIASQHSEFKDKLKAELKLVKKEFRENLELHHFILSQRYEEALCLSTLLLQHRKSNFNRWNVNWIWNSLSRLPLARTISQHDGIKFYRQLFFHGITLHERGEFEESLQCFKEIRQCSDPRFVKVSPVIVGVVELGNKRDTRCPISVALLDFWISRLYFKLEMVKDGSALVNKYNEEQQDGIFLGSYLNITIDLEQIGIQNVSQLIIQRLTVIIKNSPEFRQFVRSMSLNNLELRHIHFVDEFNKPKTQVRLNDLPYYSRRIAIASSGTDNIYSRLNENIILIESSQLSEITCEVHLDSAKVRFNSIAPDFVSALTNIRLCNIQVIGEGINDFLKCCGFLNSLHLDNINAKIKLNFLPNSLKELFLKNVNVCTKPESLCVDQELKLFRLTICAYSEEMIDIISSTISHMKLELNRRTNM